MMAKDDLKKLKSKDPATRKEAIRSVAKSLDRNALHQLAVMSGDDPDSDIRKLAQQAGVYIRQKLGDIDDPNTGKSAKPQRIAVDNADAQKARQLVQYASIQSDGGDKVKAMKALAKAISLDPNLREDSFYLSLSESLTGLEGSEAIRGLRDEQRMEQTAQKDAVLKLDKAVKSHQDEINTATGRDVLFDAFLVLMITTVVCVVLLLLATNRATEYKTALEANRQALGVALLEEGIPRIVWTDGTVGDSDTPYVIPQDIAFIYASLPITPDTPKIDVMKPNETFEQETIPYWADLGFGRILGRGIGIGMLVVIASLLMAGVIHLFATTFFNGMGRFAYTAHRLLSLLIGRLIVFATIGFVATLLYFGMAGDSTITLIIAGILGIFILFTLLTGTMTLKKVYRFNIGFAFICLSIGLAVALVLGGGGGFLLTRVV